MLLWSIQASAYWIWPCYEIISSFVMMFNLVGINFLSRPCYIMDLLQMDCLREPFFDHDDRRRHLAVRILMTTSKWLDNDDYVIM